MKKLLFFLMAFAIMLTSCVKEVENPFYQPSMVPINSNGEYAIVFGDYYARTKATVGSKSSYGYDSFALYAWNSNGDTVMNPYTVNYVSGGFEYDGIGSQELQYFKNAANYYNFIGVIPTTYNMTRDGDTVKVDSVYSFIVDDNRKDGVANITADSPAEFLYAYANVDKTNYNKLVTLPFRHGNAIISIGLSSDRNDTKIIDYVPGTPGSPANPGTPDTETYTKKTTKFIDELVAGNEVQVAIGFYGANSPKLTENNPNPLYVGTNNTTNGWLSKDWLLSIKDAVNSQFVYYRLNEVNNSTSKTETTEDWESAASNKNIFMMKLADGVDKTAFAAGNDVFWNALVAHEADWVGGSPAMSFKQMFAQAYADGWRVVRINVSDANANQVLVFLSSNIEASTQVCTITPGTPATPAVPGTDTIKGIRVFTADYGTGATPYEHVAHTLVADASISPDGLAYSNRVTSDTVVTFTLPDSIRTNTVTWSPTTFYSIPGDENLNYIVVKLSYIYNGVASYDVRVPIQLPAGGLVAGKYYEYELHIKSVGNGTNDPAEAEADKDDIEVKTNPVISVDVNVTDYETGASQKITI